ncbi:MFS transporter [Rhizobium mongolense]
MKSAIPLILTAAVALVVGLQSAAITPNLALFARTRIGMTEGQTAAFLGAFYISALVCSLAIPHFTDVFGWRKASVVGSIILTAVAALLLAFVDGFGGVLLIAIGLLGPSASSIGLFFSYLRSTEQGRGHVVTMRAIFSIAWVAGPAGASFLISWRGFPGLLIAVALCSLPILLLVPFLPAAISPSPSSSSEARPLNSLNIGIMVVAFVLLQATNAVIVMVTPLIVTETLKLPVTYAGILFSAASAIEIPLFLLLGRMSQKRSPRAVVIVGSACGVTYCTLLYVFSSFPILLSAQFLNAAFTVAVMGAGMAWFQASMPMRVGLATGLYMNTSRAGALLGSPSAIMLVRVFGGDYRVAVLYAGVLTLMAIALLSFGALYFSSQQELTD